MCRLPLGKIVGWDLRPWCHRRITRWLLYLGLSGVTHIRVARLHSIDLSLLIFFQPWTTILTTLDRKGLNEAHYLHCLLEGIINEREGNLGTPIVDIS